MRRLYEWSHRRFPAYIDCRPIYVSRSLQQGGFEIQKEVNYSLYGLPVEIILANPQH
jgi:demethylmenaquinone methyltransferase/2-methoxy-6-polyprenyl-1,4-benzoquinol methylase